MKSFKDKSPASPTDLTQEQQKLRNTSWDGKAKTGWLKHFEGQKLDPFFEDFFATHKAELGTNVLDIGCGMGRYLVPMAQRGFNVTGIDASDGMRHGAEETLQELNLQAQIIKGESTKLDFPSESFDFIMSIGAIHHNMWGDIQKSIKEAVRVLKKEKFFLFQCRSTSDSMEKRRQISDTVGYTAIDLSGDKKDVIQHYFTKKELEKFAEENGLEIVTGPEEKIKDEGVGKQHARWWVVYKKT